MFGVGGRSGAGPERVRTVVSERVVDDVELSRSAGGADHCAGRVGADRRGRAETKPKITSPRNRWRRRNSVSAAEGGTSSGQPAGRRRYEIPVASKFEFGNLSLHASALITMENIRNVVIIGSGCSGHTAALYTARANLKPSGASKATNPAGQLSLTTLVENFPGFPEGIQGPELIENMRKQAGRFGAQYQLGHVVSADLSKRPFAMQFRQRNDSRPHPDHRQRRLGALAGIARREGADRSRGFIVRHLRRFLLFRQRNRGDRRRRFGHGRGDLPHPLRHQGDTDSSPRSVSRFEDHAGARAAEQEN